MTGSTDTERLVSSGRTARWLRSLRSKRTSKPLKPAPERGHPLVEPVGRAEAKAGSRPCRTSGQDFDERWSCPQPRPACGFQAGAEQPPQPAVAALVEGDCAASVSKPLKPAPERGHPLVEPVETAEAKAGSRPCGHLDKLDERWSCPSPGLRGFETGARAPSSTSGGTATRTLKPAPERWPTAGRACRDRQSEGWEPTLRTSRQAR